jgi:hypothetical protein
LLEAQMTSKGMEPTTFLNQLHQKYYIKMWMVTFMLWLLCCWETALNIIWLSPRTVWVWQIKGIFLISLQELNPKTYRPQSVTTETKLYNKWLLGRKEKECYSCTRKRN